jgi:hypothetical protein
VTSQVAALAEGTADHLWRRVQVQDRLDALDESATGPTHRARLAEDGAALAAAVEEALSAVLDAVADAGRRAALRGLRDGELGRVTPDVEVLLRAGLAVASWDGEGVAASDAGRAAAELCDELVRRVTEVVGRRVRGDG